MSLIRSVLPEEATTGPQARANAPKERNIPVITPFWFSGPIRVTRVIIQVTTIAVAVNNMQLLLQCIIMDILCLNKKFEFTDSAINEYNAHKLRKEKSRYITLVHW